jgi:hypothetical protein
MFDRVQNTVQKEERGVVRWDAALAPGGRQEFRFGYTVEYPAGAQPAELAALEGQVRQRR